MSLCFEIAKNSQNMEQIRSRPDIQSGLIQSEIWLIYDPVWSGPVSRREFAGTGFKFWDFEFRFCHAKE